MPKRSPEGAFRSAHDLAMEHVLGGKRWSPALTQLTNLYGRGGAAKAMAEVRDTLALVDPSFRKPEPIKDAYAEEWRKLFKNTITGRRMPAPPPMQHLPRMPTITGKRPEWVILDDFIPSQPLAPLTRGGA
jgi:hypothetical protein